MNYFQLQEYCKKINFKVEKENLKQYVVNSALNSNIDPFVLYANMNSSHNYYDLLDFIGQQVFFGKNNILTRIEFNASYMFSYLYPNDIPSKQDLFDLTAITSTETGIQINIVNTPFYIHFPSIKTILETHNNLKDIEFPIEDKEFKNHNQTIDYVCNGIIQTVEYIIDRMLIYMNIIFDENYLEQLNQITIIPKDLKIKYTKLNIILFMYSYYTYLIKHKDNYYNSKERNEFIKYIYENFNKYIIVEENND